VRLGNRSEPATLEGSSYRAKKRLATGCNNGVKEPSPRKETPIRKIVIGKNRSRVRE
jgi:hypothetical protein